MILNYQNLALNFQVFGSGRPLVVLHGWKDSSANWLNVGERLGEEFQVFLLDLPGFGGSDEPKEVWGVEQYVQVLSFFINEMELKSPVVVGHSHGGKIAASYLASGAAARRLVLIASSGCDSPSLEVRMRVYFFKLMKNLFRLLGARGVKLTEQLRARMGSTDYQQAGSLRATMVRVVNEKLFSVLPKIKVPTLIIWGSEDKTLDMKQAKIFRKLIAGSYISIVWGASHHPHVEAPEELAALIRTFAQELPA